MQADCSELWHTNQQLAAQVEALASQVDELLHQVDDKTLKIAECEQVSDVRGPVQSWRCQP